MPSTSESSNWKRKRLNDPVLSDTMNSLQKEDLSNPIRLAGFLDPAL